ncbi:hypothetical protein FACS189476_09970 [Spirochaetia bacterium]|nr:hypothetical protein FACS189476_09970 [Spirochaetia bacterium]
MEKKPLHSLIPLADFKALLSVDDREDALSRFCLTTATYTIEQYCHRRILRKRRSEFPTFTGDYEFPLRDYPVREILAVYVQKIRFHADFLNCSFCGAKTTPKALITPPSMAGQPELVEPDFYHTIPDCHDLEDSDLWSAPFCLVVSPGLKMVRGMSALKIHYWAGYRTGKVPADLASACLELAAWSMNRYRGRRIGMTGAVRGKAADGEHLEPSMPENVKALLEPYRRRLI